MSIWPFRDTADPHFKHLSRSERKTIFNACSTIMVIDDKVTESEAFTLVRIGEMLGFSPSKAVSLNTKNLRGLKNDTSQKGLEAAKAFSRLPRRDMTIFVSLITAVLADDRVTPEEEALVNQFGTLLGFSEPEIVQILDGCTQQKIKRSTGND